MLSPRAAVETFCHNRIQSADPFVCLDQPVLAITCVPARVRDSTFRAALIFLWLLKISDTIASLYNLWKGRKKNRRHLTSIDDNNKRYRTEEKYRSDYSRIQTRRKNSKHPFSMPTFAATVTNRHNGFLRSAPALSFNDEERISK